MEKTLAIHDKELREQIARAIEQELDGDNPVWDRAIMVATSIAKGKKE